jgi:hypothetical protein
LISVRLTRDECSSEDEFDKAEGLLLIFFPPLPKEIEDEGSRPQRAAVPMPSSTIEEVERRIFGEVMEGAKRKWATTYSHLPVPSCYKSLPCIIFKRKRIFIHI